MLRRFGALNRRALRAAALSFWTGAVQKPVGIRTLGKLTLAVLLLGNAFQTFTPLQAFQQSVHAVINSSELFLLKQLIEKAVADNTLFLHNFHEAQARAYTKDAKEA